MRRCCVGRALLAVGIFAVPLSAEAQPAAQLPRVGVLCPWVCPSPPRERLSPPITQKNPEDLMADEAFRLGLRDHGYVEGQDIVIEWRAAQGHYERLPGLAEELVRLKVDVIVTVGAPWVRAFAQTHRTIPIVLAQVADPVMGGLVASLARPGGNVTGLSLPSHELEAKQLEFLREAIPRPYGRTGLTYRRVAWVVPRTEQSHMRKEAGHGSGYYVRRLR